LVLQIAIIETVCIPVGLKDAIFPVAVMKAYGIERTDPHILNLAARRQTQIWKPGGFQCMFGRF